jgi:hypothetical protein
MIHHLKLLSPKEFIFLHFHFTISSLIHFHLFFLVFIKSNLMIYYFFPNFLIINFSLNQDFFHSIFLFIRLK